MCCCSSSGKRVALVTGFGAATKFANASEDARVQAVFAIFIRIGLEHHVPTSGALEDADGAILTLLIGGLP